MNAESLLPKPPETEAPTSFWLLLQLMFEAKHRLAESAEGHGLTMMQANVLAILEPGSPRPMSILSDKLGCDASNVTGLVDRLVKHGAIARQDNPDDRRVKNIVLTKSGVALRTAIVDELAAAEQVRLAAVLSDSERALFHELLVRIQRG
ncbi:MAG: MarR family transcriptional regulator [Candidatus Saccharibacteria bacterium]